MSINKTPVKDVFHKITFCHLFRWNVAATKSNRPKKQRNITRTCCSVSVPPLVGKILLWLKWPAPCQKKQIDTDNSGPFMFDHLEPEWPSDPSGDGEPQTTVIFRPSYAALHHLQPFSRVGHTDAKTAAYQGYDISQDYNIRAKQNHSPSHISPTSSHFHHIFFVQITSNHNPSVSLPPARTPKEGLRPWKQQQTTHNWRWKTVQPPQKFPCHSVLRFWLDSNRDAAGLTGSPSAEPKRNDGETCLVTSQDKICSVNVQIHIYIYIFMILYAYTLYVRTLWNFAKYFPKSSHL